MLQVIEKYLGPITAASRAEAIKNVIGPRSDKDAHDFMYQSITLNTGKASALLAAQGIFALVATYEMESGSAGAGQFSLVVSLTLLLLGALILMTVLKGTVSVFKVEFKDTVPLISELAISRMVRFNLALGLTFVSVVILAAGSLSRLLGCTTS